MSESRTSDIRELRIGRMLILQKGSLARRVVHAIFAIAMRLFFRRIELSQGHLVPPDQPVIFVLNHPNGLIDPALVFCSLPRRVSFLAKSTLFRTPVIGWLLRTLEALPLYRRIDPGEDVSRNRMTFDQCHKLLRKGRCIALFPEGVSHTATELRPVKTGAARIALGAISTTVNDDTGDSPIELKIIPVGLYYTSKTTFRSEALIHVGAPIDVHPVKLEPDNQPPRTEVRALSEQIDTALRQVTLNVENVQALEDVTKVEQLFSSIYESMNMKHSLSLELALRRRFAAQRWLQKLDGKPAAGSLRERIDEYERELADTGISPEHLSIATHSRWFVFRHFIIKGAILLLLTPFTILGALIHFPAYFICNAIAELYGKHDADDIASTVKVLAAIVLVPLTWLIVGFVAYFTLGLRLTLIALPIVILSGYVVMRVGEELNDFSGWFRAAYVLLRRRRRFLRLLLERRELHSEIQKLESE